MTCDEVATIASEPILIPKLEPGIQYRYPTLPLPNTLLFMFVPVVPQVKGVALVSLYFTLQILQGVMPLMTLVNEMRSQLPILGTD